MTFVIRAQIDKKKKKIRNSILYAGNNNIYLFILFKMADCGFCLYVYIYI